MRKIFFIIFSAAVCLAASAQLKTAPLFGDGMVLQQQQKVNFWGWATPDAKVNITTSWGAKAKAVADKQGKWKTTVQTPAALTSRRP